MIIEKKKGRNLSIHFNGGSANAELLFRTINSVNQLSIDVRDGICVDPPRKDR